VEHDPNALPVQDLGVTGGYVLTVHVRMADHNRNVVPCAGVSGDFLGWIVVYWTQETGPRL
jgi:hypothetical protein